MTKVGEARRSAEKIFQSYAGQIRKITAIRLAVMSFVSAASVCAYTLALPALRNFAWSFTLGDYAIRIDENVLLEILLWALLYLSYASKYRRVSRLAALGQKTRHLALPCLLAFLPVIVFFVPLRLALVNWLGKMNGLELVTTVITSWLDTPLHIIVTCATALCCLLLICLLFLAMRVMTARAIVNRQTLGKTHLLRALRDGFRHCLLPVQVFLRHAFWLMSLAVIMAEAGYLAYMYASVRVEYVALGALVLVGYWILSFGPDFWGKYESTFLCLLRRASDGEYQ